MNLDRSNYWTRSPFADVELGGERIAVQLDERGDIEFACSDSWKFRHPGDPSGRLGGEGVAAMTDVAEFQLKTLTEMLAAIDAKRAELTPYQDFDRWLGERWPYLRAAIEAGA